MKKIKFTCKLGNERTFDCDDDCNEPEFIPDMLVFNTKHENLKNGFLPECVNCMEGHVEKFLDFEEDGNIVRDDYGRPEYGFLKTCGLHVKMWNE